MTPAEINAAIIANEPWSAANYAQLQSTVAAAAPIVAPPPPPAGSTPMPQPSGSVTDAAGYNWTWGNWVSDRYGYQLRANGRALKTALAASLVNGKLRANDAGVWYEFSGDPYHPLWTPTTAP